MIFERSDKDFEIDFYLILSEATPKRLFCPAKIIVGSLMGRWLGTQASRLRSIESHLMEPQARCPRTTVHPRVRADLQSTRKEYEHLQCAKTSFIGLKILIRYAAGLPKPTFPLTKIVTALFIS